MAKIQARIIPNASRNTVASLDQAGVFRIKVAAPPQKGAANRELISFLSRRLGVRKSDVKIVSGASSRLKTIEIEGLRIDQVKTRLLES